MNVNHNKIKGMLLSTMLILVVFAFSSCTKEPPLPGEQPEKEYMDFSLELTPPGAFTPAQSRVMTDAQQNAIIRARVLVFQNDKLLYHKLGTVTDMDGGKTRVTVRLKTSQTESEMFDIMVIANQPIGYNFDPYIYKTKDELKASLNFSAPPRYFGELIMYGEALQTLIKPTTNNFKIEMLRSVARIDIGVGAYDEATDSWVGLGATFSLTEVRVVNRRNMFAAIPSATTFNSTGNVKVSEPTIPSEAKAIGTSASDALTYTDITFVDRKGRCLKSAIFLAEAPNTTDRVTLIVGGSYNSGAITYYRIDMCVPRAGTPGSYDYLNILRNHLYRINITSVSGEGFTDPQEALISAPINITTTLTPIEEGSTGGDVIFDGNNYITTDVSSVQIYGTPDGVKTYTIATVKANFVSGVAATVTGPGISGTLNLVNGVSQTISAAIPANTTTESYIIKVGRLTKVIPIRVQAPIDAHFDFLPFQNVANITVTDPQPWLTLSHKTTYVKSEQKLDNITGNADDKAVIHIDENIATTGTPRTAEALILRKNNLEKTRVIIEQVNLKGCILGHFGGEWGGDATSTGLGYTKQLAIEHIEEYALGRVNDDGTTGPNSTGMEWGFWGILTDVIEKEFGLASTISLAINNDHGMGTITPTNTFAAKYCYDKNRDTDGNGKIDNDEVVWYLPAQNQLMSLWITKTGTRPLKPLDAYFYLSATDSQTHTMWVVIFSMNGNTSSSTKNSKLRVRCVREL